MSNVNKGKRFVFTFSGNVVEVAIAPVRRDTAELWLARDKEDLFRAAFGVGEEADENDITQLGMASALPGAKNFEGCELRKGVVEITDSDGNLVATHGLEDDEIDVDDVQKIDPQTYLLDGGPTLITRSCYSGEVIYRPESTVESFDEASWHVYVMDMGSDPFISSLYFEGVDVPGGGSGGRFDSHEVWLRVPSDDGQVRQIYHAVDPHAE